MANFDILTIMANKMKFMWKQDNHQWFYQQNEDAKNNEKRR